MSTQPRSEACTPFPKNKVLHTAVDGGSYLQKVVYTAAVGVVLDGNHVELQADDVIVGSCDNIRAVLIIGVVVWEVR